MKNLRSSDLRLTSGSPLFWSLILLCVSQYWCQDDIGQKKGISHSLAIKRDTRNGEREELGPGDRSTSAIFKKQEPGHRQEPQLHLSCSSAFCALFLWKLHQWTSLLNVKPRHLKKGLTVPCPPPYLHSLSALSMTTFTPVSTPLNFYANFSYLVGGSVCVKL